MVYNNHNNLYPATYQPVQPVQPVPVMAQPNMMYGYNSYPQQQQMQSQQFAQNNMQMQQQPMQQNGYSQQSQYQQNNMQNTQNNQMDYSQQNNGNNQNMNQDYSNNNQYSNHNNSYSNSNVSNNSSVIGSHGVTSTDIIWVNGEQEVENYPIAQGHNGMFMDISEMKMYTKDGSSGLIRDFDLVESQESMQRYHQMKQIENAQFPIVDAYATEVDPSEQKKEIMDDLEEKMNEKFSSIEQKLNELNQFVGIEKDNGTTPSNKRGRSMSKKN